MLKPGFTLIELLIVIFMVGMLFSFSVPAFKAFSSSLSLNQSAQAIAGEIRALQAKAYTRHQTFSLDLASLLPNNIQLVQNHLVCFAASGFPLPGGSGTIILGNRAGQSKKIIVSSLGRVRIE